MVLLTLSAACALAWPGAGLVHADDVSVPISLQVDLLGRVAAYEQRYASQPNAEAVVLIVVRRGHTESVRAAGQIEAGIRRSATLGGRVFAGAAPLTRPCARGRSNEAAIAYLTPGLGDQAGGIASALVGAPVMTVSAVGSDAERGIVLSFELVAARPTLVVNLPQARRQGVVFSSQLLRLARVIQ
ncbi:MAG: YfiR family protein [Sandaracinaceae bacterium]|nr:YfiR family protein [Sandaracinaceae bacterium]